MVSEILTGIINTVNWNFWRNMFIYYFYITGVGGNPDETDLNLYQTVIPDYKYHFKNHILICWRFTFSGVILRTLVLRIIDFLVEHQLSGTVEERSSIDNIT